MREAAIDNTAVAIRRFRDWLRESGGSAEDGDVEIVVADEVESLIEAGEDTEVLVDPDRQPLAPHDWERIEQWLAHSRRAVLAALAELSDEQLEQQVPGGERSVRETLVHVGFVELMYAAWTFDHRSREGLAEFLTWTREIAVNRMRTLAGQNDDSLTYADWGGAPRPELWTARKAARRLIWHELLHLPEVTRRH